LPELPEVEAVCRRLRESLTSSRRIVEARILRPGIVRPQDPAMVESAVTGHEIQAIRRIGKHILIDLDYAATLHVHLRMTGNLYLVPDVRLHVASTRAWFRLENGSGIVFDDPRALGRMSLRKREEDPPDIGPEPNQISPAGFISLASRSSRSPMKLLLMDQSKIAGLGNIYAAEALFQARIHPAKPAGNVSARKLAELHAILIDTLEAAKESAYRAYSEPGSFAEGESFPVAVYGREGEPCPRCVTHKIRRIAQGGRSTYYCPKCQR
jgi:formamidopyrimidine-DNA glycosylase